MRVEELRPGMWIVWNGHPAKVVRVDGSGGQRHPWPVEIMYETVEVSTTVYIPADADLQAG